MGNSRVRAGSGRSTRSPYAAASLAAQVAAAASEICCPIIVRKAISAASTVPGTRSPGRLATSRRSGSNRLRWAAMAGAGASASHSRPTAAAASSRSARAVRVVASRARPVQTSSTMPGPWGRQTVRA